MRKNREGEGREIVPFSLRRSVASKGGMQPSLQGGTVPEVLGNGRTSWPGCSAVLAVIWGWEGGERGRRG